LDLSPRDPELWIELGDDRAQLQDPTSALTAYSEATRLAPSYAHPHWLLGNCLLKAGRLEEAFRELRLASTIVPALFVKNIELAWQSYNGEPEAIKQALHPQTVRERIALALFFSNHSLPDQAVPLMRDARHLPEEERLSLLRELLDTDRFAEAYEVWSTGREESATEHWSGAGSITDGGFEGKFAVDDPGFGWRFNRDLKTVNVSLDQGEPYSGKQSLRLDWHGDPDHSVRIVQQLVLAAPKTRYRLSFASRTQSLTTICLPLITITSRKGEAEILLGQSSPLPQGSSEWRKYVVDFATADNSRAVIISVTRAAGADGSCPIFGSMWIDDFSLEKM
jgi:tetratricopeptide (TPR) repeat protein